MDIISPLQKTKLTLLLPFNRLAQICTLSHGQFSYFLRFLKMSAFGTKRTFA